MFSRSHREHGEWRLINYCAPPAGSLCRTLLSSLLTSPPCLRERYFRLNFLTAVKNGRIMIV
jgi:hypothetical protein